MIVKTLSGNTWRMIGSLCDIAYRDVTGLALGVREDCIDMTYRGTVPIAEQDLTTPAENEVQRPTFEIWAKNNKGDDVQILAHDPVYILNDEGKTIEKL